MHGRVQSESLAAIPGIRMLDEEPAELIFDNAAVPVSGT